MASGTILLYIGIRLFRILPKTKVVLLVFVAIFFNPEFVLIDSMPLMADTFALFILSAVCLGLLLRRFTEGPPKTVLELVICLLAGFLSIVRSILFYVGGCLVLSMVVDICFRRRGKPTVQWLAQCCLIVVFFNMIPILYGNLYAYPRIASRRIENFGARIWLGRLLPHIRCQDLIQASTEIREKQVIGKRCTDEELMRTSSGEQLWSRNSFMLKTECELVGCRDQTDRARANAVYSQWVLRLIFISPPSIVKSGLENFSRMVSTPISDQLLLSEPSGLHSGCKILPRALFHQSADEFLAERNAFLRKRGAALTLWSQIFLSCCSSSVLDIQEWAFRNKRLEDLGFEQILVLLVPLLGSLQISGEKRIIHARSGGKTHLSLE